MASDPSSTEIKSDSEPWSILENLVLAQAIYKCGDTNWVAIARTIKAHPQIHRTSSFFSQKSCAIQYTQLLENLEAENRRSKQQRVNEAGTSATQEIPSVVKLAGQLYHQRILEIKGLIRQDEERFRELVAELDEIRQGKWDSQLEQELQNNPPVAEIESPSTGTGDDLSSVPTTTTASSVNSAQPAVETLSKPDEESEAATPAIATDRQEDTEKSRDISVDETTTNSTPVVDAPGILKPKATMELEDVEMTDAAETTSVSNTPALSSTEPDTAGDVEMDDVAGHTTAPSETLAVTPTDNKEADEDLTPKSNEALASKSDIAGSTAKSPSSESDLSPPDAMEEEDEAQNTLASESSSAQATVDEPMDGIQTKTEDEEEQLAQSVLREGTQSKEDHLEDEPEMASEETPEAPKEEEELQSDKDMDEEKAAAKQESEDEGEISSAVEEEEDDNVEGDEDEEDEEGESKLRKRTGRKPQKITTNVPLKRKRRGGHRGDAEDGYNSSDSEALDSATTNMSDQLTRVQMVQMDDKKWKKILMMIWTDIANHRFGAVFMQPIKEHDAPGYYHMIKRPMDLKSIKERIRDGLIANADEFHRDVLLMFMNALMYNGEETEVYQMAQAMMSEVEFIIKNFKSSQSFAPTLGGTGPVSGGGGVGSGNSSTTTTPTTKTAEGGVMLASSATAGSGPSSTSSSRRRKSSGIEMTPTE